MRYMGIDFGTKKIGLALSDESGSMAFPHSVIKNDKRMLQMIEDLAKEQRVGTIVVGHSLRGDGSENLVQAAIGVFVKDMGERTNIPVKLEPEQYSTQEALRLQGRTEQTDASAAAIILNSYLTKQRKM